MKQLIKIAFTTIFLSMLVSTLTACGGGSVSGGGSNSPSGDDGTLTLTNAPLDMNGSFIANAGHRALLRSGLLFIYWRAVEPTTEYGEGLDLIYTIATGMSSMTLAYLGGGVGPEIWACSDTDGGNTLCSGITVDITAGTVTFADQVLNSSTSSITLNGVLYFTLTNGIASAGVQVTAN